MKMPKIDPKKAGAAGISGVMLLGLVQFCYSAIGDLQSRIAKIEASSDPRVEILERDTAILMSDRSDIKAMLTEIRQDIKYLMRNGRR